MRSLTHHKPLARHIFLAAAVLLAAGLLIWRSIPLFSLSLVLDDHNLIYWATNRSPWYAAILLPLENGFWRPLPLAAARLLQTFCQTDPAPYRLLCLLIHMGNGILAGVLAWRLTRLSSLSALAGILVHLHPAAYLTALQFENIGDLLLGTWMLALCVLFAGALEDGIRTATRAWCIVPLVLLAIASKETGLAIAGVLLGWALPILAQRPVGVRRLRAPAVVVLALIAVLAVWALERQQGSAVSYGSTGRFGLHPGALRQLLDYLISLPFPGFHLTPLDTLPAPTALLLWAARGATLLAAMGAVAVLLRRRSWLELGLVLSVSSMLALPALLADAPRPRFLYTALPLWAVLLARGASRAGLPRLAAGGMLLLILLNIPFLLSNARLRVYEAHCTDLTRIRDSILQHADAIPPDSLVIVRNHPYGKPRSWPFGHFWLRVTFPAKRWNFALSDTQAPAGAPAAVFSWNGKTAELVSLP